MADEIQSGGPRQSAMPPTDPMQQGPEAEGRSDGATQEVKEQAGAVWDETKANVRSALEEQQQAAATGVGDMAGALRNAARELQGKQKPSSARLVQYAADGLERVAGTLRDKDLDTVVREAESFARREPALFLGAAVAMGFLAVRFLKSSSEHAHTSHAAGRSESRPEGSHLH